MVYLTHCFYWLPHWYCNYSLSVGTSLRFYTANIYLYATVVLILLGIISAVYSISLGCPRIFFINSLNRYMLFVEMMQITTIHFLLLYKFSKHIESRTMQQLQACCCNIRPRLWHDVIIVCIQFGLPLPLLTADIALVYLRLTLEILLILVSLLIASILLDLICIVMLVVWVCKLRKRKLLKRKTKFVTYYQLHKISYILFLLVVFLNGNIVFVISGFDSGLVVIFAIYEQLFRYLLVCTFS